MNSSNCVHHTTMQKALQEASSAASRGEVPVGAVIMTQGGGILSSQGNRTIEHNDPTAHAEILAIRQACQVMSQDRLRDCVMYVTLEPCPMCATAISFARIKTLYYGTPDPKGGGILQGPRIFDQPTCHHRPTVMGPILAQESRDLLQQFFRNLRLEKKMLSK